MAAVSEEERTGVLRPHIPDGEQLITTFTGEIKTVALTDRRVIELHHLSGQDSTETEVKSVLLTSDYVVGTEYENRKETEKADVERLVGGLLVGVGVLAIIAALAEIVFAVFGIAFILLGSAVIYGAEDEEDGQVTMTLRRAGDIPDMTWSFPRGETQVAAAMSEQVARLNQPE